MLMTLGGTSTVISSLSIVGFRALAPAYAVSATPKAAAIIATIKTATQASDSFNISSYLSLVFICVGTISASSLRQVSSKMSLICSGVIVNNTYIVTVKLGMEKELLALRSFFGVLWLYCKQLFGCKVVMQKKQKQVKKKRL